MTSGISSAVRQLINQANLNEANSGDGAVTGEGGFLEIITQSLQTIAQTQMQNAGNGQATSADMLAELIESLKKQPTAQAMEAVMALFAQNPQLLDAFITQQESNGINIDGGIFEKLGENPLEFMQNICSSKQDAEKIASFLEGLSKAEKQDINSEMNKLNEMKDLFQKLGGEVVKEHDETVKSESTEDYLSVLKSFANQKSKIGKDDKNIDESQVKVFTIKDLITSDSKNVDVKDVKNTESLKTDKFEIINQFKESFLENISQKRFTVRLKPEGLGEITVNMLNNEGKLSLSILASNQTVQRALEGNLANLQSSLKQYNAEITSINEATGKQQSALDLNYGREHSGQQPNGQNQNRHQQFRFDYNENVSEEAQDMINLREYLMATNSLSIRV